MRIHPNQLQLVSVDRALPCPACQLSSRHSRLDVGRLGLAVAGEPGRLCWRCVPELLGEKFERLLYVLHDLKAAVGAMPLGDHAAAAGDLVHDLAQLLAPQVPAEDGAA